MERLQILLLLFFASYCQATTYVVDNNADTDNLAPYTTSDGTNTLRKCIRLANSSPGLDIINFNLPASTVISNTIGGGGAWLSISDPVDINGYTQPTASAGNLRVELNGASNGRWFGLELQAGATGSTIRGLIIYGTNIGIRLAPNSNNNRIAGCWIGVNNSGNAAASNPITEHGIRVEGASNNLIGGSGGLIDRNIISSCGQEGIRFQVPASSNNTLNGNYIGVGLNGNIRLNNRNGIFAEQVNNLIIGAGNANEGNILSGNNERGIYLVNCDNFTIKGNTIGLAADLLTIITNNIHGMSIVSGSDIGQIGGSTANERNIISGNTNHGMEFNDADNISIQGNYIGLAGDGSTARGNNSVGIIAVNCAFMTVGGSSPGQGNVISSNGAQGMALYGASSRNTTIQGNIIGLSATGSIARGNGLHGIAINENEDSQIGGTTVASRNIVSANTGVGIYVINSPRTVVQGNYVGVDATGLIDMGNLQNGVQVDNTTDVVIGGTRNIISGNNLNGIELTGTSSGAMIRGNFIGIGADGSTLIKNDQNGIRSIQDAHNMTIGGSLRSERNVISGNGSFVVDADPDNGFIGDAVRILGSDNHLIQNNYLGTDSTGTIGLGNHWAGVSINDGSLNNQVLDNLISDNRNEGIWIYNGSNNNQIFRNIIGEDINGNPLGNWDFGVVIEIGSVGNIIGGSPANANVIANTRGERPGINGDGVTLAPTAGNNNQITFNNIHCNAGKGILRLGSSNESQAAPTITVSNANDINGTGSNGRTIHLYLNVSADGGVNCDCEGEVYIGSTTVFGTTWSFTHNLGLNASQAAAVSATQTTPTGSTSEFSICTPPILLPIELLSFRGLLTPSNTVDLFWKTSTEINSDYFQIERSINGQQWESIGNLDAATNSMIQQNYYFEDLGPDLNKAGAYYRLKQVDLDEAYTFSEAIYIEFDKNTTGNISLFPNPSQTTLNIKGEGISTSNFTVLNVLGVDVSRHCSTQRINTDYLLIDISELAAGVYYFVANGGELKKAFIKE